MFPSIAQTWPQMMYHAELAPVYVKDPLEKESRTRQGYSSTYIKRAYPVMMYHAELEPRKAENPTEKQAMEAEGWTTKHTLVKQPTHEMNADGKMVPMPDRHLPVPRAANPGQFAPSNFRSGPGKTGGVSGNSQADPRAEQGAVGGTGPGDPVNPAVPVTPLAPLNVNPPKTDPAKK